MFTDLLLERGNYTLPVYYNQKRGKILVPTTHSVARKLEREVGFSRNEWRWFGEQLFDLERQLSVDDEILVYSKSLNQALIIAYRYDRYRNDREYQSIMSKGGISLDEPHFYVITTLPRGRSRPKPGTEKFIIEWTYTENGKKLFEQEFIDYMVNDVGLDETVGVQRPVKDLTVWFKDEKFLAIDKKHFVLD